jgi:hypothetical protein
MDKDPRDESPGGTRVLPRQRHRSVLALNVLRHDPGLSASAISGFVSIGFSELSISLRQQVLIHHNLKVARFQEHSTTKVNRDDVFTHNNIVSRLLRPGASRARSSSVIDARTAHLAQNISVFGPEILHNFRFSRWRALAVGRR